MKIQQYSQYAKYFISHVHHRICDQNCCSSLPRDECYWMFMEEVCQGFAPTLEFYTKHSILAVANTQQQDHPALKKQPGKMSRKSFRFPFWIDCNIKKKKKNLKRQTSSGQSSFMQIHKSIINFETRCIRVILGPHCIEFWKR